MSNVYIIGVLPVVVLLIVLGTLIKYKKAYWLISGYNTMSDEKKKNVDIEGLGKLAANVCFLIAGLIFVASIFILIGKSSAAMFVFALIIPTALYTLIKAQKFDRNNHDDKGKMKKGTKALIGIITGIFILIATGVGVLMYFSSRPAVYTLENGMLKISGMYGQEIPVYEITSLEIKDSMPEVLVKTNGSELETMLKGYFKLKDIGEAKLFIDISKKPFVYITYTTDTPRIIVLNCEENEKTRELYKKLEDEWNKSAHE